MPKQFKGMGVAMVTPFQSDKNVDFKALEQLTKHLIDGGADYLVVMGTTGESVTLSKEEKRSVLEFITGINAGKLPVVYGLGGNNTAELLREMEQVNWSAVDAILSVSPYYNKPTQRGIVAHYHELDKQTPRPILLYNVPGRTASNILPETTLQLAECTNIIGIKEASGNLEQCMQIIKNKPDDFLVISGDDPLVLPFLACGGDGVISVVGNAFPRQFSEMVHAAFENNYNRARTIHYQLIDVIQHLFAEGNPAGIKEALSLLGIAGTDCRLPLVAMSDKGSLKMKRLLSDSALI